jgi:hypothetical protein
LVSPVDLLVPKLEAADERTRRPQKRRIDLLDIINLAEEHPVAAQAVPRLRQRFEHLGSALLTLGRTLQIVVL